MGMDHRIGFIKRGEKSILFGEIMSEHEGTMQATMLVGRLEAFLKIYIHPRRRYCNLG